MIEPRAYWSISPIQKQDDPPDIRRNDEKGWKLRIQFLKFKITLHNNHDPLSIMVTPYKGKLKVRRISKRLNQKSRIRIYITENFIHNIFM